MHAYYNDYLIECWQRVSKITNDRAYRLEKFPDSLVNFYIYHNINVSDVVVDSRLAVDIFRSELKSIKGFSYPEKKVVFFGSTKNNLREFHFLNDIISMDLKSDFFVNVAFDKPDFVDITDAVNAEKETVVQIFEAWLSDQKHIPGWTLLSVIWCTRTFLAWILANPDHVVNKVPLVVVANDHYPTTVAFVQAARLKNIPTLYIQHAEVTDHFPPLLFDFNVLHNRRTLQVYKSIGPVIGENYILSRWEGKFDYQRLSRKLKSDVVVVLYLTSNYFIDKVDTIVEKLNANNYISEFYIKPHPRTPDSEVVTLNTRYNGKVVRKLEKIPDVAVVQNSSVVTELFHQGVKVYHLPGTDWLPGDYYGFVKDGICDSVDMSDLASSFWDSSNYDSDWLSRYENLNPSLSGKNAEQEASLRRRIFDIIAARASELISTK